jgi:hypothetical protein
MKTRTRKEFLTLLSQSNTPKRRKLLASWADKNDIGAVSEISLNALKGNIALNTRQLEQLRKSRYFMRQLASKRCSVCKK